MEKRTPAESPHKEASLSLAELCEALSISTATGRNWIRSGKLAPEKIVGKRPYFSAAYANSIIQKLQNEKSSALKSRRNKKYVSGNLMYTSYVSDHSLGAQSVQDALAAIQRCGVRLTQEVMAAILGECAVQLFLHDSILRYCGSCLEQYLKGTILLGDYGFLVDELIGDRHKVMGITENYPELFSTVFEYEAGEDTLGLLYLSIRDIAQRKASGAYYTPTRVVQKLCQKLFQKNPIGQKRILDPCCGTGNFLLQLPERIPFDCIYGIDLDSTSIKIARINMALKYGISEKSLLYGHIRQQDYLLQPLDMAFGFIIGNPPWGYAYSKEEKALLQKRYESAQGAAIESYDLFLEQSLRDLELGGILSFVLPEALLNVKSHAPIRRLLLESCSFQYLGFLGNAFDNVQCPCVILQMLHNGKPASCIGMEVSAPETPGQAINRSFTIQIERTPHDGCFGCFAADEEYMVLEKISRLQGKRRLLGNAIFALGIVTGNNKDYISEQKKAGYEVVLKGSDLCRYRRLPGNHYLKFQPEAFQQTAPAKYYRAPEKLLYRFICSQLVFAYDDQQTLSLNSCNLLIPQIEGLEIKYILAILNSRIAQFYFKKQFHSMKVLRSHIEQIPIPWAEKKQQGQMIRQVDKILDASLEEDVRELYDALDLAIAQLYGLDAFEYGTILEALKGENLFLC